MSRRFTTLLLGSISLVALSAPAWADTESAETVVVTAEKRSEAIKEVPMSITAIGQDQLDKLNARDFDDLLAQVPGLTVSEDDPTHSELILRGINAGGDGSTVATYIDETPYGSSSNLANGIDNSANIDTYDMKRVEVLRGPQGTLYGAGAEGGLLKFVTNAPDATGFDDSIELGGTDMEHGGVGGSVRGMVNVAVTDDLAVRVVGYDQHTSGYISDPGRGLNGLNDLTSFGGRASVLYQPTDKFSIRLSASDQQLDSGDASVEDIQLVGTKVVPLYGDYEEKRNFNEPDGARDFLYNATLNWDVDFATITSSTSFGELRSDAFTDASGVPSLGGFNLQADLTQKKFTQELRVASNPGSGRLEWLAGVYYTNETGELLQNITTLPGLPPVLPAYFLQLDSQYDEIAGFGNLKYHITPDLDVGFGARYSSDNQNALQTGIEGVTAGASTGDKFTWSADLHYRLDEQTDIYARAATGFHPGGPNALAAGAPPNIPSSFGPDSLIDYEAGVKSDMPSAKLSFDADVFYIDWNSIQLITVINNVGVNQNGGTARSEGLEGNVNWKPIDGLTLNFNGAYTEAQLTQTTNLYAGGLSGNSLPYAPKWSGSVNGDYEFAPIGDWSPYVGATLHFVGSRVAGFNPGYVPQDELPSYATFDVRLGVDWKKWSLEFYGKNLNDGKGISFIGGGTSSASGEAPSAAIIAPRLIGLVLRGKI